MQKTGGERGGVHFIKVNWGILYNRKENKLEGRLGEKSVLDGISFTRHKKNIFLIRQKKSSRSKALQRREGTKGK